MGKEITGAKNFFFTDLSLYIYSNKGNTDRRVWLSTQIVDNLS